MIRPRSSPCRPLGTREPQYLGLFSLKPIDLETNIPFTAFQVQSKILALFHVEFGWIWTGRFLHSFGIVCGRRRHAWCASWWCCSSVLVSLLRIAMARVAA